MGELCMEIFDQGATQPSLLDSSPSLTPNHYITNSLPQAMLQRPIKMHVFYVEGKVSLSFNRTNLMTEDEI